QPYRASALKPGQPYYISGQYELSYRRFAVMNPSVELVSDFPVNTARIIPVYRETKGLTSKQIRRVVHEALSVLRNTPETLPDWLLKGQQLMARAPAIETMHFPADMATLE